MRKVICIFAIIIITGCSNRPVPQGILMPEKMSKVVYDLSKVDEYLSNYVAKDTTVNVKMKRSIFYEQVFKLNNTSKKEFYTSYKYYQQHPDIQKALFDSVSAKAAIVTPAPTHISPTKPVNIKK